jgi:hypothetical protein
MKYRIKFVPKGRVHSWFAIFPYKATMDLYISQYKKFGVWWNIYQWSGTEDAARESIEKYKKSTVIIEVE